MESNPIIDQLPDHLKQYIKPQNYESYSAINQSVWKYVMRRNISFLKKHAHDFYITGLKKDVKHMHDGIHDLGGKIDKIYWVLLGTVGAVSLLLLEKVLDKGFFF